MDWLQIFSSAIDSFVSPLSAQFSIIPSPNVPGFGFLAEKFISGQFEWNDLLWYGLYLIKIMLLAAGVTAVIGIMEGGYRYILGSLVEDKEKGRDSIKNTLIGFVLVVLAWAIVDLVVVLITVGE